MPELVDTHVHLDHPRLRPCLAEVLSLARQMGVGKMINVGHDLESSLAGIDLADENDCIWAAIGVHPHSAATLDQAALDQLAALAPRSKVVAIGEIGLDYHYDYSPRSQQKEAFRAQLRLAADLGLPVIIHQREAEEDVLEILDRVGPLRYGGVLHCFSGSLATLDSCLALNLSVGLGGMVTFAKAEAVRAAARAVPLERLVLETDCPYLAPHPHRGKTNQPAYLPLVAAQISRLRGIEEGELIEACKENAQALFGLAKRIKGR